MANHRPPVARAPTGPEIAAPPSPSPTPVRKPGGLGRLLDARLAFGQAQGMLAELTGCTLAAAGKVLLQVGAQLGLESADSVAEFFLVAATTAPGGPEAQAFIRQARNSARAAQPKRPLPEPTVAADELIPDTFATLMPDGRRLVVHGELDIATAPLLVNAFNGRDRATSTGGSFVLDLHDLTFVDLYGVRALAEVQVQTAAEGYQLRVDPPSNKVTRQTLQFAVRSGWLVPEFADAAPWMR